MERERLDYKREQEGEILVQQTPAQASGQVSPSASSTSYVTCTPDISYSIQTGSPSATLAKIIDIQRIAKRRNDTKTTSLLQDDSSSNDQQHQQQQSR